MPYVVGQHIRIILTYILSGEHSSLEEIIKIARRKYQDKFDPRLFLEQLIYLEDIKDTSIQFLNEPIAKDVIRQFFQKAMNKIPLSVIVIAYNDEKIITDCLESVSWAEELIVVNNGSTDKTSKLARKLGATVIGSPKNGIDFSKLRNVGAKSAHQKWLFYIDTDERASLEVKNEIINAINKDHYSGYNFPRQNIFLGHPMRHGGWWPDMVLRLIKKSDLKGWRGSLHEQPEIAGKIGVLKNPLVHYSHRSLSEMLNKTNEWSGLEAKLLYDAHHPEMTWWRFISVAFREFWYRGIVKLGFLDGTVGVIEIIYQMFSRMITYAKLWELQVKAKEVK